MPASGLEVISCEPAQPVDGRPDGLSLPPVEPRWLQRTRERTVADVESRLRLASYEAQPPKIGSVVKPITSTTSNGCRQQSVDFRCLNGLLGALRVGLDGGRRHCRISPAGPVQGGRAFPCRLSRRCTGLVPDCSEIFRSASWEWLGNQVSATFLKHVHN